jgi:hypothetical protein
MGDFVTACVPIAANGLAKAAWDGWLARRATLYHRAGKEKPAHNIDPYRRSLVPARHQQEQWQSDANLTLYCPYLKAFLKCKMRL